LETDINNVLESENLERFEALGSRIGLPGVHIVGKVALDDEPKDKGVGLVATTDSSP
jgi:hypothetical protein